MPSPEWWNISPVQHRIYIVIIFLAEFWKYQISKYMNPNPISEFKVNSVRSCTAIGAFPYALKFGSLIST